MGSGDWLVEQEGVRAMERRVEINAQRLDLVGCVPGTWHLICWAGADVQGE